jgi:hypothetical protein
MPQSFRSKFAPSEPADRPVRRQAHWQSAPAAFGQAGAELGEAAWHHNEAFEHLSARVECLSSRLQQARMALSPPRATLLDGVVDALAGLKAGIAGMRRTWEGDPWPAQAAWSRLSAGRLPTTTEAEPWDAETAEALTRVCEVAAVEDDKRSRRQRPLPAPPEAAANSEAPQTARTQALEARLAALAERLQQALPRLDPAQWLGPIDARIAELEREVATALERVSAPCEPNGLSTVEAMVRDLASRAEQTRTELARLNVIEGHLREMVAQLKSFDAADKPRAALPATHPANPQGDRTHTLEGLLKACAAARRQDARTAVGVLQSIHHAIADIVERLDAQANNDELSFGAAAFGGSDPHADHDLLLKAYREGARALGESLPDATQEGGGRAGAYRHSAGVGPLRWPWQTKD